MDILGLGHGLHGLDGLAHQLFQGEAPESQRSASAMHSLEVENVVDQPHQAVGIGDGDAQQARCLFADLAQQPAESSPSAPRIEVSGVRSSWLTVEMNSSFMWSSA